MQRSSISKMPSIDCRQPLLILLGPTAVGKTELSIHLAERVGGEIISADSRLFYRGMDIGTAKPSAAERARVPHHMIDISEPDESVSLAVYQSMVQPLVDEIAARGKLPILVGGTGQYIRAITESWRPPRTEPDPRMRVVLENWTQEIGKDGLYERLAYLDPAAAAKIDLRNVRRTIRAVEVILATGIRFSEQRKKEESPYHILQIGLFRPREELYTRIDQRIDAMLRDGFVDEVRNLLEKDYKPQLPALSAIGYLEIAAYLQGKTTLEESITLIRRATRVFVRRQANWFKPNDPSICWFQVQPGVDELIEAKVRETFHILAG